MSNSNSSIDISSNSPSRKTFTDRKNPAAFGVQPIKTPSTTSTLNGPLTAGASVFGGTTPTSAGGLFTKGPSRRDTKKYSKLELMQLFQPSEILPENFIIFDQVFSKECLEPLNKTFYKLDKDAVCFHFFKFFLLKPIVILFVRELIQILCMHLLEEEVEAQEEEVVAVAEEEVLIQQLLIQLGLVPLWKMMANLMTICLLLLAFCKKPKQVG